MVTIPTQEVFPGIGVSLDDRISEAIELVREWEQEALRVDPVNGYHLACSFGKDSIVLKQLAIEAGVRFRSEYGQTTIDPPELIRYGKQYHQDVAWRRPKRNFFRAVIDSHGLPTRLVRWCCEEFKESVGDGKVKLLGVRRAESARRRANWETVNQWRSELGGMTICPLAHWSTEDVWHFIESRHLPYCSLYDEGFTRLGCVGCPMSGSARRVEFRRWPGFEKTYRRATQLYWEPRHTKLNRFGEPYYCARFKSGDEMFDWWLSDNPSPKEEEQECLNLA